MDCAPCSSYGRRKVGSDFSLQRRERPPANQPSIIAVLSAPCHPDLTPVWRCTSGSLSYESKPFRNVVGDSMHTFLQDVEEIRRRAENKIEEGAVTASYKGDVEKTISILNEALATEIVCVLRYMHHYFMATGVHGKGVADEFKEHADSEREHADLIAERIQQLGGKPDFNPKSLLERSVSQYVEGESLAQMIREDLIAERIVIDVYQEMIRHFGSNDPTTRIMIEHILKDEEEHASDLSDLLYITDPETGETMGRDPGMQFEQEELLSRHSQRGIGK